MYDDKFERDDFVLNATSQESSVGSESVSRDFIIKHYYESQRKFTEKELENMRKSFETVVVNDFSDEYHLSDEEKYANAEIAKLSKTLARTKRKCNNLYDYVLAMRIRMDIIEYVAKTNGVFSEKKFMKKVLNGDIILKGFSFPKYTGKNRKGINWEYVSEYILDRERDPKDLKKQKYRPVDIDEIDDIDEFRRNVFSPEMYREIFEEQNEGETDILVEEIKGKKIKDKYGDEIYRNMFIGGKQFKDKLSSAKELGYIFNRINDMDEVSSLDEKRRLKNGALKRPKFTGDPSSKKDIAEWYNRVQDWERENVLVKSGNGSMTQEQLDEIAIRDFLEKNGWNVRKFGEVSLHKRKKKDRRNDRKRSKRVAENIKDASERNNGKYVAKKKKKKSKKERERDNCVEDAHKVADDLMMGLTEGDYEDFEQYSKEMETCSFDSVFGKD